MKSNDFFKKEKLEEILIANWPSFFDGSRLMNFILEKVNENIHNLAIVSGYETKFKGNKITISRFFWNSTHFNIWIEFTVALNSQIIEGTSEVNLYFDGEIEHIHMIGCIGNKL